ncbi:hypothetical protein [Paenibacillus agricola]|uniref:hypothetical protein n=1 Tax=Paenibacillus agricola TaxID=2716264 RepID=UPI001A9F93EF|nr:hypothetical protein [Paenibacillus agricola]
MADQYRDMTAQQLSFHPYHKQVWAWWKALAYYGMNGNYERLEDAPNGMRSIWIIGKTNLNYIWKNGKYEYLQQITKEDCKNIYGDKTPGTY